MLFNVTYLSKKGAIIMLQLIYILKCTLSIYSTAKKLGNYSLQFYG